MKPGLYIDPVYPMQDYFFDGANWWCLDLEFNWIKRVVFANPHGFRGLVLVMEVNK